MAMLGVQNPFPDVLAVPLRQDSAEPEPWCVTQ